MKLNSPDLDRRQFLTSALAVMGASALAGLAGCSSSSDSSTSSTTSKEVSFDGNFVVGFDQEFPPYGYVGDDGTYTGFDLDLAQAVCAMESWTYTPTPIS